jgi:hypothetical protein
LSPNCHRQYHCVAVDRRCYNLPRRCFEHMLWDTKALVEEKLSTLELVFQHWRMNIRPHLTWLDMLVLLELKIFGQPSEVSVRLRTRMGEFYCIKLFSVPGNK